MNTVATYVPRVQFDLEALSIELPPIAEEHPNRVPFTGVLTRVDEPSTRPPGGSEGHKVFIPAAVAEAAIPSLMGMPVNAQLAGRNLLKGHDQRRVIGVITGANVVGRDLRIEGYLYGKNFADEVKEIQQKKGRLGFSYEISQIDVADQEAQVWVLQHFIFTGAAVLEKNAAAYQNTSIAAQAEEESAMAETALLDAVREIDAKVDAMMAAHEADSDEEAARRHDEEAKSHDEEAAASRLAAKRARDDKDDEDAARHEETAKACMTKAVAKRSAAMTYHAAMATSKREEKDEEAAKMHEAEAARLEAANAKCKDEAAAHESEAAALIAARTASAGTQSAKSDLLMAMIQAMAGKDVAAAKPKKTDDDEDDMDRLMRAFVKAMTFAPGMAANKEHPDEEEDKSLIKRLLRQDKGDQAAAAPVDLKTRRDIRNLQASVELLTDTVKKMAGLITDGIQIRAGLSTDRASGGPNGGAAPARKTMQATTAAFQGKYDAVNANTKRKEGSVTVTELNEKMKKENLDTRQQMARVLEMHAAGLLIEE